MTAHAVDTDQPNWDGTDQPNLTKGESVDDLECANLTLEDYMQDQIYKDESSEIIGSKNQLGGSFKRVDSLA